MRCFKDEVTGLGYKVFYNKLSEKNKNKDFISLLSEFLNKNKFKTISPGGELNFIKKNNANIEMMGPAKYIYSGNIDV